MRRGAFGVVASGLAAICVAIFAALVFLGFGHFSLPEPLEASAPDLLPTAGESRGLRYLDLSRPVRAECPAQSADYFFPPGTFAIESNLRRRSRWARSHCPAQVKMAIRSIASRGFERFIRRSWCTSPARATESGLPG